jgi:hypothetical protein
MQKLKKIIFSLFFIFPLLFLVLNFVAIQSTFAQEKASEDSFVTKIETSYTVDRNGTTQVSHHIRITNQTPTIYLKQYALKTSYYGLENITVKSGEKEIQANTVSNNSGTNIGITFEDDVVGQGKIRDFYIEYLNKDLATVAGNVLEVHIPQLGDNTSFNSNKTILITPAYFALPVRVNPTPTKSDFVQTQVRTEFDRPNGESISAIFGMEQNYKMTLRYHLENPSSSPAIAQIALPPDTQFQKLHYHALDPLPNEMKQDVDGNWIATYRIPASSVTVVHLTAEALVTLEANTTPVTKPTAIHTKNDQYWESKNPVILEKAQQFSSPQAIYDHVVNTLSYSRKELTLESLNRYGAVDAFENPEDAVCQEFADTYIAIARAADIPTRRLIGYAHTENSLLRPLSFEGDVLHAWPEYYDTAQNKWISIDPTWGNTTGGIDYFNQFDLNHIVFTINGNSSSLPNPAGSYKVLSEAETKDVEVSISDTIFPQIGPEITTTLEQKKFFFIPLPGMFTISITNETGQAWYDIQPHITAHDPSVAVSFGKDSKINSLLPYQTQTFDVTFFTEEFTLPSTSEISVSYAWSSTKELLYEPSKQTIISGPKFITAFQKQETYVYLGIGAVILTLITGSILVFRQKR